MGTRPERPGSRRSRRPNRLIGPRRGRAPRNPAAPDSVKASGPPAWSRRPTAALAQGRGRVGSGDADRRQDPRDRPLPLQRGHDLLDLGVRRGRRVTLRRKIRPVEGGLGAGATGLESAASGVTVRPLDGSETASRSRTRSHRHEQHGEPAGLAGGLKLGRQMAAGKPSRRRDWPLNLPSRLWPAETSRHHVKICSRYSPADGTRREGAYTRERARCRDCS
jgi:hypothetical protein